MSKKTIQDDLTATQVDTSHPPEPAAEPDLTERQSKVLEMKEKGLTDEQVAGELGVTRSTVARDKCVIAERVKEVAPVTVTAGRDGKTYPAARQVLLQRARGDAQQFHQLGFVAGPLAVQGVGHPPPRRPRTGRTRRSR